MLHLAIGTTGSIVTEVGMSVSSIVVLKYLQFLLYTLPSAVCAKYDRLPTLSTTFAFFHCLPSSGCIPSVV